MNCLWSSFEKGESVVKSIAHYLYWLVQRESSVDSVVDLNQRTSEYKSIETAMRSLFTVQESEERDMTG